MDTVLSWMVLWLAGVGLFIYFMITLVRQLVIRYSQGVEANVRAAESIVNDERVPAAWTAPGAGTRSACAGWTGLCSFMRRATW